MEGPHIIWHHATVTRASREAQNGHKSRVLWFTGLSGSGKSTLAHALEEHFHQQGYRTMVLDGDNVRHGLCQDLGFSVEDRQENMRRIGEMTKLFLDAGILVLAAFISPFREDRRRIKALVGPDDFVEIYCRCPLAVCEQRDTKGLYQRAKAGLIDQFTGVSSPYEVPESAHVVVETAEESIQTCLAHIVAYLETVSLLHPTHAL